MPSTFTANSRASRCRPFNVEDLARIFLITLGLLLALVARARGIEDIPNVHVADRTRYLSNPDGVISPEAQAGADRIMRDIWNATSAEVVAVVVDSISSGSDPDTFATDLFEHWGVGKKDNDNGLLLLVSVNDHAAVIRTGYGMEGVVPDIVAGEIIRNELFPRFREGDYDGGLLAGLNALSQVITTPEGADELMSKYANDADASGDDDVWIGFLCVGGGLCVLALLYIGWIAVSNRNDTMGEWKKLNDIRVPLLALSIMFLLLPMPAFLVLWWRMKTLRRKAPRCPRCHARMQLLPHGEDARWLSSGQQVERRLASVDHDVWECPECQYGTVHSFDNASSAYTRCEKCGAKANHLVRDRIVRQSTTLSEGYGQKEFHCEHCGHDDNKPYRIARKTPVVVVPGGRGFGGGGFGGGISGGSFGGGHTGGGGASGRW